MNRIFRKRLDDSEQVRLLTSDGKDVATLDEDNRIVYPNDVALKIAQGYNSHDRVSKVIEGLQAELRTYQAKRKDVKSLDLRPITEKSGGEVEVYLEQFTDELMTTPWLKLNSVTLLPESAVLEANIDGVTDFEHSSAKSVWIKLINPTFSYIYPYAFGISAWLSPDPKQIKIYNEDWRPEEATPCEDENCQPHLIIDNYTPPMYKYARAVAGAKIKIQVRCSN